MRRFTRKNTNRSQQDPDTRHLKTEFDLKSCSESSQKNYSLQDISIDQNSSNSKKKGGISLLASLLKKFVSKEYRQFWQGMKTNKQKSVGRQKRTQKMCKAMQKILNKFKYNAYAKIKEQRNRIKICATAADWICAVANRVWKRGKMEFFGKLSAIERGRLAKENKKLREVEQRYAENEIGDEHMRVLRKFSKISPKNQKYFLKSSLQQILPTTTQLQVQLQTKRTHKNLKSDTEILVTILNNYIAYAQQKQKQLNLISIDRDLIVENEKKNKKNRKEIEKVYDEVVAKVQVAKIGGWGIAALKSIEKLLEKYTDSVAGNQGQNKSSMIKCLLELVRRIIQAQQGIGSLNLSPISSPRSPLQTSRSHRSAQKSVIQQKNILQQSDLIDHIMLLSQNVLKMIKQPTPPLASEKPLPSNTPTPPLPGLRQLQSLHKMFQQIEQEIADKNRAYEKLEKINFQLVGNNQEIWKELEELNIEFTLQLQQKNIEILGLQAKLEALKKDIAEIGIQTQSQSPDQKFGKLYNMSEKDTKEKEVIKKISRQVQRFKSVLNQNQGKLTVARDRINQSIQRSLNKSRQAIRRSRQKSPNPQKKNKFPVPKCSPISAGSGSSVLSPIGSQNCTYCIRNSQLISDLKIQIEKQMHKIQQLQYQNSKNYPLEYVLILIYNIIVRVYKLKQKSQEAEILWQNIDNIANQNKLGWELKGDVVMGKIEDFVVQMLNNNKIKQQQIHKTVKKQATYSES